MEELRDMKLKEAAKKVHDGIEATLTYCDFPFEHLAAGCDDAAFAGLLHSAGTCKRICASLLTVPSRAKSSSFLPDLSIIIYIAE